MNMPPPNTPVFGQQIDGVVYRDRPGAYALLANARGELATIQTSYGLFLPGGGLDPGEDEKTGLAREIMEEMGHVLLEANALGYAIQFTWSAFYQCHFKKVGAFYRVKTQAPPSARCAPGHTLLWVSPETARAQLTQEFQRWAIGL